MFLAARYPDRHARDETQRLLESGSSRFKPLLLILSGPGSRTSRNGSLMCDFAQGIFTVMLIATACIVGSTLSFARGGVVHLLARGGVEHGLGGGFVRNATTLPCAKSHIRQGMDRR